MTTGWLEKPERRRLLAAGTLIGILFWLTAELLLVPENRIDRLNLLTTHPEIRWVMGGSFLLTLFSSIGLVLDIGYQKLLPQIRPFLQTLDTVFTDPLTWLILALMTHTIYISEILQWAGNTHTLILGTNLFVILYLTAFRVISD